MVAVAVEDKGEKKIGRIRLSIIPDASSASFTTFVQRCVEEGSTIRTDDWTGYSDLKSSGYFHEIAKEQGLEDSASGYFFAEALAFGNASRCG